MSDPAPLEEKASPQKSSRSAAGDCWSCRLLSGGGLTAAGIYVFAQVHRRNLGKPPTVSAVLQMMFATGLSAWGIVLIADPVGRITSK
ncbi:distal membrane-arm assembly complex protein 1-like [Danio aesculapii]|uniref:distal membrane-arm assembly complex protein 1-like n=1 Tax=Danio aesculapii TaxID=1142201 RepID=UPI0024BFECFD|nr:distal membrane-arm assembly complex protein 1-like [Danio aesculapii]